MISHDNVIRFVDIYTPELDVPHFRNVYIVTDYAGVSIKQVLDKQKQSSIRLINHDHVKFGYDFLIIKII
jgi:hypothetical protein